MSHTPTLKLAVKTESDHTGWKGISIIDQDGLAIANMVMCLTDGERAKAKHIVHCVNTHEQLVEALKMVESCFAPEDNDITAQAVRQALAMAEKGVPCKP